MILSIDKSFKILSSESLVIKISDLVLILDAIHPLLTQSLGPHSKFSLFTPPQTTTLHLHFCLENLGFAFPAVSYHVTCGSFLLTRFRNGETYSPSDNNQSSFRLNRKLLTLKINYIIFCL